MEINKLFQKLPYRLFVNLGNTYGNGESKQMVVRKQDYLVTKLDEKLVGFPGAIGLAEMQVLVLWNPTPSGVWGDGVEEYEPMPTFVMSSAPLEGFSTLPLAHRRVGGPRIWISQPTAIDKTDGQRKECVNPTFKFLGQILAEEASILGTEPELGQAKY